VQAGDPGQAGQPLAGAVISRLDFTSTTLASGRIQILVPAGSTFARGKPIATLA
jgi:hypothetical protein